MGRLVDVDELNIIKEKLRIFDSFISSITRQYTDEHQAIYEHWIDCRYDIEAVIDKLPTAYDVGKVVAEFESAENYYCDDEFDKDGELISYKAVRQDVALDIVRKGGVNE